MVQMDLIGLCGIRFFGKMSASISHDLKNVLAVINENAGLLEDFCLMAEKGKPFDPARLKRLAADVRHQILRGDQIITSMNKFAHSVDSESLTVDLSEVVGLLVELCLRYASMRGVRVEIERPPGPVMITTFPFVLLNLLWCCLDYAMTAAGSGKTIELAVDKTTEGGRLRLRKLEGINATGSFPTEAENVLGKALNAQIRVDPGSREIVVSLPGKVQEM